MPLFHFVSITSTNTSFSAASCFLRTEDSLNYAAPDARLFPTDFPWFKQDTRHEVSMVVTRTVCRINANKVVGMLFHPENPCAG